MKRTLLTLLSVSLLSLMPLLAPVPPAPAQEKQPEKKADPAAPAVVRATGYRPPTPEKRAALYTESKNRHGGRLAMLAKFQSLPPAFDTRERKWCVPVGDQGSCGSCYLYSTIWGTLSSAFVKAGYGKPDGSLIMSVQYGMDCHNFGGCNGGNGTEVMEWVMANGWPAEKYVDPTTGVRITNYPPYEARSNRCRLPVNAKLSRPADWGMVAASANRPATTLEIKTALTNFGCLNVSLDAGGQFGNGTGTITTLGRGINHEIELIAYDDAKDGGSFLLKNQWGCYNEDMDILTSRGWMKIKDISEDEVVATLNPMTHALEYQGIQKKHEYDFDGEMYHYKAQGVDLMVTPNHRMYVGDWKGGKWRLEEAQNIRQKHFRMKKDADWTAPDVESYRVGDVDIPMDLWLEFLGYFVSEGHTNRHVHQRPERQAVRTKSDGSSRVTNYAASVQTDYMVGVSQKSGVKADVMQKCLDRMPFTFWRGSAGWTTNSKPLWEELSGLGKSWEKNLPAYTRSVSKRQSMILLDALMLGDGTKLYGNYVYFTSSKQLSDDVQELALRAGLAADVSFIDRIGRETKNGVARHIEYRVSIKTTRVEPHPGDGWKPDKVPYKGKVYCVTVPNHIIYVRRNGQATWCGNSDWGNNGVRWVTYQAAQNLVDVFWVSATPLPPPPPPPDPDPPVPPIPPGPGPNPGTVHHVAVRYNDGSTQTFYPVRKGTTLEELSAIIATVNASKDVPPAPMADPFAARWARQDELNKAQLEVNEAIPKALADIAREVKALKDEVKALKEKK